MQSSSDDMTSSDDEIEQLANIATRNFKECLNIEKMETNSETDDDDSESEECEAQDSDDIDSENEHAVLSKESEEGSELFIIDRTPTTQSESISLMKEETNTSRQRNKSVKKNKNFKKNSKNDRHKSNDKNNDFQLASEIGVGMKLPGIYINVKPLQNHCQKMEEFIKLQKNNLKGELKVMKNSVITPDFEKTEALPKYHEAVRKIKRDRKKLREMTKGKQWFDLPKLDLTEENKNSLMVLQMRKALDPKRFYKSNDLKDFPKYCQFGTIVEGAADFYSGRIPKKQRKQTIVEELLADAEFRTYNKRKFEEIQSSMRRGTGAYQGSKRMMHKKKGPVRRQPDKNQKKFFVDSSALKGKRRGKR